MLKVEDCDEKGNVPDYSAMTQKKNARIASAKAHALAQARTRAVQDSTERGSAKTLVEVTGSRKRQKSLKASDNHAQEYDFEDIIVLPTRNSLALTRHAPTHSALPSTAPALLSGRGRGQRGSNSSASVYPASINLTNPSTSREPSLVLKLTNPRSKVPPPVPVPVPVPVATPDKVIRKEKEKTKISAATGKNRRNSIEILEPAVPDPPPVPLGRKRTREEKVNAELDVAAVKPVVVDTKAKSKLKGKGKVEPVVEEIIVQTKVRISKASRMSATINVDEIEVVDVDANEESVPDTRVGRRRKSSLETPAPVSTTSRVYTKKSHLLTGTAPSSSSCPPFNESVLSEDPLTAAIYHTFSSSNNQLDSENVSEGFSAIAALAGLDFLTHTDAGKGKCLK